MLGRLGMGEMLIILVVVLLLFGATRLPQLGRSLGEGMRNLKKGLSGADDDAPANPPGSGPSSGSGDKPASS